MKIRILLAACLLAANSALAQQPIPIQSLPQATIPISPNDLTMVGQSNILRKATVAQMLVGSSFGNQTANAIFSGPASGSPAAPTFRSLVGADLPAPGPTALGGVKSFSAVTHQWVKSLSTAGALTSTQPACSDLSGVAASCGTDATNASNITSGTLPDARLSANLQSLAGASNVAASSLTQVSPGTYQWLASSPANVVLYGADPTGIAPSQAAIVAAWSVSHVLYFPPGTYTISGTLTDPWTGSTIASGFIGAGSGSTRIVSFSTTVDMIDVTSFAPIYSGLTLSRSSAASAGAGLNIGLTINIGTLNDLYIKNQHTGIALGGTGFSNISNVILTNNTGDGLTCVPLSGQACQWQMFNILSQLNDGNGFTITGSGATSVGQMSKLSTFANGGAGFSASGAAAIRLSDSFFGADNGDEVIVSGGSADYAHVFTNVYTELSVTGRGFSFISSAIGGESLVNCAAVANALSGVFHNNAYNLSITGGNFKDNGATSTPSNTYGVRIGAGTATVTGVIAPVSGTQTTGLFAGASATFATALGNNTGGNGAPFINFSAAGGSYIQGNY